MQIQGNTILITGGGSGIGRALAVALHQRGNQVIIAGRRKARLDEVTAAYPGMQSLELDIQDAGAIKVFASRLVRDYPSLNAVVHNAGIMQTENLRTDDTASAEAMITTNLLGPLRLHAALVQHLLAQPRATVVTVSSGLAFMPLAGTPTYCATKAAIHSWTQSLRYQLKDTTIEVHEIVPPYVQTELLHPGQAHDERAMPLQAFIDEVMQILSSQPEAEEVLVERVMPLRFAEQSGKADAFFRQFNDQMAEHRG